MSYWVYLNDAKSKKSMKVDNHQEGGTYAYGGIEEAELNITYNYSKQYYEHLDKEGLRWLSGKTASKTIPKLRLAIKALGRTRSDDYWSPTKGNAGYALSILLKWAKKNPDAIWQVN